MSETFGISTDHNKDISRVVVRPCTGPWMMEGWNAERSSQVVVPWWWYKFRMYSCKIYITQINAHKRRWPNEEGADRSRLASSRGNTNLSRADRSVGEGEFSRPPPGGKKKEKCLGNSESTQSTRKSQKFASAFARAFHLSASAAAPISSPLDFFAYCGFW